MYSFIINHSLMHPIMHKVVGFVISYSLFFITKIF
nr:MAG TPA: hypothetical protein [Caudoviricetes sp.]